MLSKIFAASGIGISTFGTIITLWSVLSTTKKQIEYMRTAAGYDEGAIGKSFYKAKPYAICGIIVIVIGAALQIAALFV